MRTEFGFERTVVGGPLEQINCKFIPGYLIPADLERIAAHMGSPGIANWAKDHLLASKGAKIIRMGKLLRIPTLVPARNLATGHCMHYENGQCKIHPVAPFGCAFFDATQSDAEAQRRSIQGLMAVEADWKAGGPYSQIWSMLDGLGKRAMPPEECRKKIDLAYERLKRKGKI